MSMSQHRLAMHPEGESAWDWLRGFESFPNQGIRRISLPSVMELIFVDFKSSAPMTHNFAIGRAPIIFSFHLSGFAMARVVQPSKGEKAIAGEPNKAIISYIPGTSWETEIMGQQHYRVLNIYVQPQRLYSLLDHEWDLLPRDLHRAIEAPSPKPYNWCGDISPPTLAILGQIYNCPYQGAFRRLHLECKSLELIVRQLYEALGGRAENKKCRLRPDDVERIHQAKTILIRDVENPPSLVDLARRVGVNTTKPKQGFRQVCGTTPYALVRRERLNQAQRLLHEGRLNVTEISHQLGFCDTSHFIREFSKHYGATPGKYAKTYSH